MKERLKSIRFFSKKGSRNAKIMKITLFLLFVGIFTLQAANMNSQPANISLKAKNMTLKRLFNEIESKSNYVFLISDDASGELDKKVSLDTDGQNIIEILDNVLKGTNLSYLANKRQISIYRNNSKTAPLVLLQQDPKTDIVTGTVLDKDGQTLIGVTVSVKGTTVGVHTDIDGFFSISAKEGQTLVLSYVGFEKQEITVTKKKQLTVVMQSSLETLDEVVVVGYGIQRKLTLTGSISSIKTKEIKQSAVSNLSNALVGRLPGLFARQSKGEVGGDGSTIRLRGTGTYGSQKDPLIMIDGVPRDGFQYIDPNEVESITILKDASATAVYGVKGANGVILVTTRRGEASEKPRVTVNVEQAFSQPLEMLTYLNSADYFRVFRRGLINDGQVQDAQTYSDEYIAMYDPSSYGQNPDNKYLYPNTDWTKELLKDWSYRTTANINISGGSDRMRYFVSGSFFNESGLYKRTEEAEGYNAQATESRINFRSNVDIKLSSWLSTDINLATIIRKRNYPGTNGDALFQLIKYTPSYDYPIKNPDGSIAAGTSRDVSNPYAALVHSGYEKLNNSYLQGTIGLNANLDFILKGLSAKIRFSYDAQNSGGYKRVKNYTAYQYLGNGEYTVKKEGEDFLSYTPSGDYWKMTSSPEVYLMYDTKINKMHTISAMALYRSSSISVRSENNDVSQAAIGALPFREQGIVGRLTYGYNDKYFAEFNFGFNGSENFASSKRFGFFPSVSASWVLNKEGFLNSTDKWLEMLKLRASVGKVGNADPGTRFAYQSRWSFNSGNYSMGTTNQNKILQATELAVGNPDVTWETATKYDVGLDILVNKGIFGFSGDIFFEHRTGIFDGIAPITSALMGWKVYPKENTGIVDNKGFEFEISHSNRIGKDISYELKGSYTFTKNKIKKFMEAPQPNRPWLERTGRSIHAIKTYQTLGLFQTWDEISNSASQNQFTPNLQPGDVKYYDLDGDGSITTYDQAYLNKNSEANQVFGFSMQFKYKNFDIAALFQGALGRYVYMDVYALFGRAAEMRQIFSDFDNNYWTPENTDAKYPRPMGIKNTNNIQQSTYWLKSGDYLRLKNMEIGYTIPRELTRKWSMEQVRLYANGNNLLTWDKLDGLFDPEEESGGIRYPLLRTFNVGLSITF